MKDTTDSVRFKIRSDLVAGVGLAVLIWIAHFANFLSFGLYEDDYAYLSQTLRWSLTDFFKSIGEVLITWPQARPPGLALAQTVSFLASKLGGLGPIYLVSFGVIWLNAYLFYKILARLLPGYRLFPWMGALIFALFPADTTHTFLMYNLGMHTSLTCLLAAILLFLSGKTALSYGLAALSLLIFETPYLAFLGIPLLAYPWDRALIKKMIRHVVVVGLILAVFFLIRLALGQIQGVRSLADWGNLAVRTGGLWSVGMLYSVVGMGYGIIHTLTHFSWQLAIVLIISLAIIVGIFRWRRIGFFSAPGPEDKIEILHILSRDWSVWGSHQFSRVAKFILAGLFMWACGYLLAFLHNPPTLDGKGTSVHVGAAFGASLVFASLIWFLIAFSKANRWRLVTTSLIILYLALLVTFRYSVQEDFVQAWTNQKWFWTEVIPLIADVQDKSVVFVINHDLPSTHFIQSSSWADPILLEQLAEFPKEWNQPPRVFVVPADWASRVVPEGNALKWLVPAAIARAHWETLPENNLIILEMENGQMARRVDPVILQGQPFALKPESSEKESLKPGYLSHYMRITVWGGKE